MIQLKKLVLARAGRVLIEDASLQIHPGQKVGVVGANGCGKSSLFALLAGELHQDSGVVELPPRWVQARVAQETSAAAAPALEYVLDGDAELRRVEAEIAAAQAAHAGERLAHAHEHLRTIDGYSARSRAAALLHGLGFGEDDLARPVAQFSGGWRVRLNLARALMCRSDLLLLDEPTNHLDLDAVIWLEQWLRAYPGTLLLVSHDRDFLDAVADSIVHIENRRLKLYGGNYTTFERARAEQLALQQALYDKQQREIAHLHRYIERFRAKATKARQAQSRIKALARLEELAPAHVDSPFSFCFAEPAASPDPLLLIEDGVAGYDDAIVLERLQLVLRPGERVGLLGRNGAGKSTLVKTLAGQLPLLAGSRLEGKGLAIGYFAQHQLEQLRADESPLQHLLRLVPQTREQELRDYLGGFDFRGAMAMSSVGNFSGGEKSRLALALLIRRRPNLLLLDEPTNHLDLEMRHALTLALSEYEGAVVLVSHDRHLLRSTVDRLLLVADGGAAPFDGDLEDYRAWLDARRAPLSSKAVASNASSRKEQRREEAALRARLALLRKPLEQEIARLEQQMAHWGEEKHGLEAQLAQAASYDPGKAALLQTALRRQAELSRQIEAAEERWLALHTELEKIESKP